MRVNAFVAGGALPAAMRGKVLHELRDGMGLVSTYAAIAGVDPTDYVAAAAGLPPIDSVNQWPLLSGTNATAPRRSIVLGDTSAPLPRRRRRHAGGRAHRRRLGPRRRRLSPPHYKHHVTGPNWPNETSHLEPLLHVKTCGRELRHGVHITADPEECG